MYRIANCLPSAAVAAGSRRLPGAGHLERSWQHWKRWRNRGILADLYSLWKVAVVVESAAVSSEAAAIAPDPVAAWWRRCCFVAFEKLEQKLCPDVEELVGPWGD